jgi:hypothetical protein
MAIAEIVNFNNVVGAGIRLGPADHWDGYTENIGGNIFGGLYQGTSLNFGGFDHPYSGVPFTNQPHSGYNTNWGKIEVGGISGAFAAQPYVGYNTNYSALGEYDNRAIYNSDINSVVDHPKDQTIYYKLKGWNPLTSAYEVWVISENITGRPELFDPTPGRSPPNVERDIFKTPPSGNSLTGIVIVARWAQ